MWSLHIYLYELLLLKPLYMNMWIDTWVCQECFFPVVLVIFIFIIFATLKWQRTWVSESGLMIVSYMCIYESRFFPQLSRNSWEVCLTWSFLLEWTGCPHNKFQFNPTPLYCLSKSIEAITALNCILPASNHDRGLLFVKYI